MDDQTTKKLLGVVQIPQEIIEDYQSSVEDIVGLQKKIEEYLTKEITSLLSLILIGGIKLNASDIHIEPQEDKLRLRFRIDGILNDIAFLNNQTYRSLLSRIKLLSRLKLNIVEKPQEGRFSIMMGDFTIEIRSSSLPSEYGESVLMRILDPKNLMELEALGLRKDIYTILDQQIKMPNGMIAVSGPTGSGKTTTLYAFLMKIKTPGIKIITIEDPIEYHLEGISQTQVNPDEGYTFSKGLMSIIRQDPDVILIGEIRDSETAKISLQASLTGHLVLTSAHTNDAAGTIPRLTDLGVELSTIAPALRTVVSQRLVRLVCKKCLKLSAPSKDDLLVIKKSLKSLPKNVEISRHFDKIKIPNASEKGCKECNFTGYLGRKGIFEIFTVTPEVEKFILSNQPVSAIKELLIKRGMVTIYQSGLIEVILGHTTMEEVERVVGSEEKLEVSKRRSKRTKKRKKHPRKMSYKQICRALGIKPDSNIRAIMSKLISVNFKLSKKLVLNKEETKKLEKIKKFYRDWNLSMSVADPVFDTLKKARNNKQKRRKIRHKKKIKHRKKSPHKKLTHKLKHGKHDKKKAKKLSKKLHKKVKHKGKKVIKKTPNKKLNKKTSKPTKKKKK